MSLQSDLQDGLSSQGMERAQCLRNVFGASSGYNIGYIITEVRATLKVRELNDCSSDDFPFDLQDYKSDGSRERPYETVEPLASDLGLTIDHHCDRDDTDCATVSKGTQ